MFATALCLASFGSLPPALAPQADEPAMQPTVVWFDGTYEEALVKAAEEDKLVFIDFWVNWSDWCRRFHRESLDDARVVAALDDYICLNYDAESDEGKRVAERFSMRTYPTLFFVRGDGRTDDVIGGFIQAQNMVGELARIGAGKNTVSGYEAQLVAKPMDHDVRWALANKLWDLDDRVGYAEHIKFIEESDPEGKSAPMRRMAMNSLMEDVYGCRQDTGQFDTTLLEEFIREEQHAILRWEGWKYLGDTYAEFGHVAEARAAYVKSWPDVQAANRSPFAYLLVTYFLTEPETLTKKDRAFAVKVADIALDERRQNAVDPRLVAPYWELRAQLHWAMDERTEALGAMRQAVRADPSQQVWSDQLAKWREQQGVATRR